MGCYGPSNLNTRHLASDYDNLAPGTFGLFEQPAECPVLTAVDKRDMTIGGHWGRYHRLAEKARCDKQVIKRVVELLAPLTACADLPLGPLGALAGGLKLFSMNDALAKMEFGVLAISFMVSLEITSNLPSSGKFGGVIGPGEVAELDSMFTLVDCHERMNKTSVVILPRGPKTAYAALGFEDGHIECPLWLVMEE